jgi:DNA-binding HxlR family transcriptional regulator
VGLDRAIHERIRLGVMTALAGGGVHTFAELREGLGVTEGNLSEHLRRLEETGYVKCEKGFAGRLPRSEYCLTAVGKKAVKQYWEQMELLSRASRGQKARRRAN